MREKTTAERKAVVWWTLTSRSLLHWNHWNIDWVTLCRILTNSYFSHNPYSSVHSLTNIYTHMLDTHSLPHVICLLAVWLQLFTRSRPFPCESFIKWRISESPSDGRWEKWESEDREREEKKGLGVEEAGNSLCGSGFGKSCWDEETDCWEKSQEAGSESLAADFPSLSLFPLLPLPSFCSLHENRRSVSEWEAFSDEADKHNANTWSSCWTHGEQVWHFFFPVHDRQNVTIWQAIYSYSQYSDLKSVRQDIRWSMSFLLLFASALDLVRL